MIDLSTSAIDLDSFYGLSALVSINLDRKFLFCVKMGGFSRVFKQFWETFRIVTFLGSCSLVRNEGNR